MLLRSPSESPTPPLLLLMALLSQPTRSARSMRMPAVRGGTGGSQLLQASQRLRAKWQARYTRCCRITCGMGANEPVDHTAAE